MYYCFGYLYALQVYWEVKNILVITEQEYLFSNAEVGVGNSISFFLVCQIFILTPRIFSVNF